MKSKFKSWTLWVNFVGGVGALFLQQFDLVQPEAAWSIAASAVVNFLLRFKTSQPIV